MEESPLTDWERVDRALEEIRSRLTASETEEQFQVVGMIVRETLITIAQQVFKSNKHPTKDGVQESKTDAKRMLEVFLKYELKETSEKTRKYTRASVDLGNQLTHERGATKRKATICLISISSIAAMVKTLDEEVN